MTGQTDPKKHPIYDPHALQSTRIWGDHPPKTSRFWLGEKQDYFEAMLDFIMVSDDLRQSKWRIWHPIHDPALGKNLAQALLAASDHFPVTLDFAAPAD